MDVEAQEFRRIDRYGSLPEICLSSCEYEQGKQVGLNFDVLANNQNHGDLGGDKSHSGVSTLHARFMHAMP